MHHFSAPIRLLWWRDAREWSVSGLWRWDPGSGSINRRVHSTRRENRCQRIAANLANRKERRTSGRGLKGWGGICEPTRESESSPRCLIAGRRASLASFSTSATLKSYAWHAGVIGRRSACFIAPAIRSRPRKRHSPFQPARLEAVHDFSSSRCHVPAARPPPPSPSLRVYARKIILSRRRRAKKVRDTSRLRGEWKSIGNYARSILFSPTHVPLGKRF